MRLKLNSVSWDRSAVVLLSFFLLYLFSSGCSQISQSFRPSQSAPRGDAQRTLDAYDAAIAADPNDPQLRLLRCGFLAGLLHAVKDQQDLIQARALSDCDHVLKTSKDPRQIAKAYDALRILGGRMVFQARDEVCPEDARKAAATALFLIYGNKFRESLPHYKTAVDRCPQSGSLWIEYGHTFMMVGDMQQAKVFMSEGLKRDPWNRSGHLFLSDLYRGQGDLELAYKHSALAVVSDPSYEFGWEQLRELVVARGREWRRTINRRPVVRRDSAGKPNIYLPLGTDLKSSETDFWFTFGLIELSELNQAAKDSPEKKDNRSALERDRARVKKNLEHQRYLIEKDPKKRSLITDVVEEAVQKGFLDEAISFPSSMPGSRLNTSLIERKTESGYSIISRRF